LYGMYQRGPDVVNLQMVLGLSAVDGIYGPVTRAAHMEYLGGPQQAVYVFYPELVDGLRASSSTQTLTELVDRFFRPDDRTWALKVALCESSGLPHHTGSTEVSSALAVGWFQHLVRYWGDRSDRAGYGGWDPFDSEANVAVAAWLFYTSGPQHWNPSRTCWGEQ